MKQSRRHPRQTQPDRSRLYLLHLIPLALASALILGCSLFLAGCEFGFSLSCGEDGGTTSGEFSTYTNPDFGFSFDYPSEWEIQEGSEAELTSGSGSVGGVSVYDPRGASVGGYVVNLVQVSVYKLAVAVDETMMDTVKSEIERVLADLESQDPTLRRLEELSESRVGSLPGYKTAYEFSYGGTPTRTTFYFLFNGDTQYQLSTQAVVEDWDNYQDEFQRVVDTFSAFELEQ